MLLLALCMLELLPWCAVVLLFVRVTLAYKDQEEALLIQTHALKIYNREEPSPKQEKKDTNNTMTKKNYLLNKKKKTQHPSTTTFLYPVE
jgi:hypothetical protein